MFRNSNFYTVIITTVALLAGLTYAIQMVAARADDQWRQSLRRVIGMTVFIHVLLLPTAAMCSGLISKTPRLAFVEKSGSN